MLVHSRTSSIEFICDDIVADLLAELSLSPMHVDPIDVARGLGMEVAIDAGQSGRARIKRIAGRHAVLLRPEERPERMHWALAHEIGEALAHRIADRLQDDSADMSLLREQWANVFASRLLLPRDGFLPAARCCGCDIIQLKQLFPRVSYEQLLWGLLRLDVPMVGTVFDQGALTRRESNTGNRPALTSWEREMWREVHSSGRASEAVRDDYRLQCWPVHEAEWQRELLRVTEDG